ncbi:MAG: methyl-accepting chemotaxis protein [Pseudomonadota bacterium]
MASHSQIHPPDTDPAWSAAPIPQEEADRLAALRAFNALDTDPEREFDDLVVLSCSIFGVATSLISMVDSERQWFKAKVGLDAQETRRDLAFCTHAILSDATFVVPDATADLRFAENPLVKGPPHIRFYAGAPLVTGQGFRIGTFSILDPVPRPEGITAEQDHQLRTLARITMDRLEARRAAQSREADLSVFRRAADALIDLSKRMEDNAATLSDAASSSASGAKAATEAVLNLNALGDHVNSEVASISKSIDNAAESAHLVREGVEVFSSHLETVLEVLKNVSSIAQQTRILAINASIEAARAGEAGAGFSVIAREIGELAGSTANATESIRRTSRTITQALYGASTRCEHLDGLMNIIRSNIGSVEKAATDVTATHHDIRDTMKTLTSLSDRVGAQSNELASWSSSLSDEARHFQRAARSDAAPRASGPGHDPADTRVQPGRRDALASTARQAS